jgi:hypothetical protein
MGDPSGNKDATRNPARTPPTNQDDKAAPESAMSLVLEDDPESKPPPPAVKAEAPSFDGGGGVDSLTAGDLAGAPLFAELREAVRRTRLRTNNSTAGGIFLFVGIVGGGVGWVLTGGWAAVVIGLVVGVAAAIAAAFIVTTLRMWKARRTLAATYGVSCSDLGRLSTLMASQFDMCEGLRDGVNALDNLYVPDRAKDQDNARRAREAISLILDALEQQGAIRIQRGRLALEEFKRRFSRVAIGADATDEFYLKATTIADATQNLLAAHAELIALARDVVADAKQAGEE